MRLSVTEFFFLLSRVVLFAFPSACRARGVSVPSTWGSSRARPPRAATLITKCRLDCFSIPLQSHHSIESSANKVKGRGTSRLRHPLTNRMNQCTWQKAFMPRAAAGPLQEASRRCSAPHSGLKRGCCLAEDAQSLDGHQSICHRASEGWRLLRCGCD